MNEQQKTQEILLELLSSIPYPRNKIFRDVLWNDWFHGEVHLFLKTISEHKDFSPYKEKLLKGAEEIESTNNVKSTNNVICRHLQKKLTTLPPSKG